MKNIYSSMLFLIFIILTVFQNKIYSQATYDSQFGSNGTGNGEFDQPNGIAILSNGNLVVADRNNERVQIFNSSGVYQSQFGSLGSGDGQFASNNGPVDMAVDGSDNIWVVDRGNSRVQQFNSSGIYQAQFGSNGSGNGQFDNPNGIAILSNGNIVVADRNNERVQIFNGSGVYQSQFGSVGSGDGQFATNNGAVDIAIDGSDNIWVVDRGNHRVQRFNSSGVYQDQFGSNGTGNGQFNQPNGIGVAPNGDVYVCDRLNERVQVFNSSGVYQSQFGSVGSGDGQFASNNGCVDLEFDGSTAVFVVDRGNHRIQKFTDPALPVDLTSFTALLINDTVKLSWQTATEVNNYGFEIERQYTEPGTQNSEWKTIGFVEGHGNSNSPKKYEFIDTLNPNLNLSLNPVLKYRLKQIDTDGTYEYYSLTAEVDATITSVNDPSADGLPEEFHLSQNYPNPFNPTTTIQYGVPLISKNSQFSIPNSQLITLVIYDVLGNEVSQLVNKVQEPGYYQVEFNAEHLSSGLYIYQIKTKGFLSSKKMLLVK